jgi:hypothetical protein
MSMKSRLSAAALVAFVAMSAAATTSANAYSSRLCDGAVTRQACGAHIAYVEGLRSRRHHTSHAYVDPREEAMRNAGGGAGGGGGGGR